jgi:curli biogenesis system outer membrane secretion channel CsgG
MTEQITQAGKLTVVESDLTFLNQELALGNSASVKQGTGPRLGQMQGADLALLGDIIIFGRDDQRKSGGLVGFGGGVFGGLGGGGKSSKAVVVISYRLINVETREVLLSAQARGESKREDRNLVGAILTKGGGGAARMDMTSSNFAQTILGEATIDSIQKLATAMTDKAGTLPTRFVEVDARVASVNGSVVTINVGTNEGVQAGDVFEISKILGEVKDPVTGEILDLQLEPAGQLVISEVRPRVSIGNFTGSTVATNYVARKKRQ